MMKLRKFQSHPDVGSAFFAKVCFVLHDGMARKEHLLCPALRAGLDRLLGRFAVRFVLDLASEDKSAYRFVLLPVASKVRHPRLWNTAWFATD